MLERAVVFQVQVGFENKGRRLSGSALQLCTLTAPGKDLRSPPSPPPGRALTHCLVGTLFKFMVSLRICLWAGDTHEHGHYSVYLSPSSSGDGACR